MLAPPASIRALAFHRRLPLPRPHPLALLPHSPVPPPPRPCPTATRALMVFPAETASEDEAEEEALPVAAGAGDGGEVSTEEWQRWGTSAPLPTVVGAVVRQLLDMESAAGEKMRFGGVGSKLKGDFKDVEDRKHRAVYKTLPDSDQKLQYYSARQIGCRLLGSRGYLCQKCWLPMEDCMCSKLVPCNLWRGIRFWLYMHPKDFLRQNNTGKLLWQVFGIEAASLCLFGIQEHEDIMWDAFQRSGKEKVSFLYPNKSATPKSVKDLKFDDLNLNADLQEEACISFFKHPFCDLNCCKPAFNIQNIYRGVQREPLNLVLLDGTWSNSAALYRRLKERWTATWGEEDIPCISLSMLSASVMHKLRPQPAWDRTCTAAAAAGLLSELHMRPELSEFELEGQAEAVECSLDILLDALTVRRVRLGRSITRKQRHRRDCI